MHIETYQAVQREVGIAGPLVSLMDPAVQCHHQTDGMFGNGLGGVSRNPYYAQTQLLGGNQIHIVVTCTAHGQHLGAISCQIGQHRTAEIVIDEATDYGVAMSQTGCLAIEPDIKIIELIAELLIS